MGEWCLIPLMAAVFAYGYVLMGKVDAFMERQQKREEQAESGDEGKRAHIPGGNQEGNVVK